MKRAVFIFLSGLVRLALRYPLGLKGFLAWAAARVIAAGIKPYCRAQDPDAVTVLLFSAFRFREDLDRLRDTGKLTLLIAPTARLQAINSMFAIKPDLGEFQEYMYFLEENPEILRNRAELDEFCTAISRHLKTMAGVDCALTPAAHYEYEHPWAHAFGAAGIPFVALHKEFTVLSRRLLDIRVNRYRERRNKFRGTDLLVVNDTAKRVFADSDTIGGEAIRVVGMPRMDDLFDPAGALRKLKPARKTVTLFSFAHYSGDLHPTERRSKLFSARDHEGFVDLFRNVHVAIAELALEFPDVDFAIKPKNVVDWWIVEIDNVMKAETGKGLADLDNCDVIERPAAELIAESDAVIGFNSTVLLEAKALEKPTIVPVFDEAVDKYPNNIYLKDELDIFQVATSKEDLKTRIRAALNGDAEPVSASPERLTEVFRQYVGYDDHHSTVRVVDALRDISRGMAS